MQVRSLSSPGYFNRHSQSLNGKTSPMSASPKFGAIVHISPMFSFVRLTGADRMKTGVISAVTGYLSGNAVEATIQKVTDNAKAAFAGWAATMSTTALATGQFLNGCFKAAAEKVVNNGPSSKMSSIGQFIYNIK
jgi:hypothetical protein